MIEIIHRYNALENKDDVERQWSCVIVIIFVQWFLR